MTEDDHNEKQTEDENPDTPTAQDHECQFCHESFDTEEAMREHVESEHSTADESSGDD